MKTSMIWILFFTAFFACRKSAPVTEPVTPPPPTATTPRTNGSTPGTNTTDREYNLQVVYFVPKDMDTVKNYEARLSELMLWGQNWFKEKMAAYGYDKTFGMHTDADRKKIRIITVYGTKTAAEYAAEGGASPYWNEIEAYFTANPSLRTSDHFINILPRYGFKPTGEPTGGPYYGIRIGKNRICFVLDYEDMELKNMSDQTDKGKWCRIYFGGLLHELGHALNLPHNMHTTTQLADPTKGTSLMSSGNYTLGAKPTFLTPFDCAILNDCQVMNKGNAAYYGTVNVSLTKLDGSYDAGKKAIILSGEFSSTGTVNNIGILHDPDVNNEGTGNDRDYNAVSFATKPTGNSFSIEMPVSEFTYRSNEKYELRLHFVHSNGISVVRSYTYQFVNGLPVIDVGSRQEIAKTGWTVAGFSSEEASASEGGKAKEIIDGSLNTYWHSRWTSNAPSYPHFVTIDIGAAKTVQGLSFTQRQTLSRTVKDFEILVSADGVTFTSQGNKQATSTTGTQYFSFDSPQTFRYFKVISKSSWDGTQNAAIAEVGLY